MGLGNSNRHTSSCMTTTEISVFPKVDIVVPNDDINNSTHALSLNRINTINLEIQIFNFIRY